MSYAKEFAHALFNRVGTRFLILAFGNKVNGALVTVVLRRVAYINRICRDSVF